MADWNQGHRPPRLGGVVMTATPMFLVLTLIV